ncbi:MAG: T9SS type A sorting domain-containing protein [Saprospiraceae bacterium]|nr:T9SS type A sorting domain-containing protein [Saprospiraceae bacterium]
MRALFLSMAVLCLFTADTFAQSCAPEARRNNTTGRRLFLVYPTQAERDLAATQISSIDVLGVGTNLAVQAHPSQTTVIRTNNLGDNTFSDPFTGIVTYNLTAGGTITCNYSNNLLPVELTEFNVDSEGSTISLAWKTASEENNAGFEIQQSQDGIAFEAMGWIEGAGTTITSRSYSFQLTNQPGGQYFFRLRQVDEDGRASFSKIVFVELGDDPKSVSVFPSLVRRGEMVNVFSNEVLAFTVYNSFGQEVAVSDIDNQVNTSSLASGMYFIVFENGRKARFVVQ